MTYRELLQILKNIETNEESELLDNSVDLIFDSENTIALDLALSLSQNYLTFIPRFEEGE